MKTLYRYEVYSTELSVRIAKRDYLIIKETPKGYWIKHYGLLKQKKWVAKNAKNGFAYPTAREALFNFIKRKEKYIKILESILINTKQALELANKMYSENDTKNK